MIALDEYRAFRSAYDIDNANAAEHLARLDPDGDSLISKSEFETLLVDFLLSDDPEALLPCSSGTSDAPRSPGGENRIPPGRAHPSFYVGMAHAGNTSANATSGYWWQPLPVGEIASLIGSDWAACCQGEPSSRSRRRSYVICALL